jgi:transposase
MNSAEVGAYWEHRRREVPGRLVISWDGSPLHRRHPLQECRAHGASPRLHLVRLPAYAPERNPDEGFWPQFKGVEWRNVCCFALRHLRDELRAALTPVRRQPRLLKGCSVGAGR